jgi:hypothetical protein
MSNETYVATEPLFIGVTRAHNPGDEVPAENVQKWGWHDQVTRSTTTAAAEVPGVYDPSLHSVAEVTAHLKVADDAERDRVIAAERAGRNRPGITGS